MRRFVCREPDCYALAALLCSTTAAVASASQGPPTHGQYTAKAKIYDVPTFDRTDQHVHVFYPETAPNGSRFPLIAYAHGLFGGGEVDIVGYHLLFEQIASFGYVVAAPAGCSVGCADTTNPPFTDCAGLLPVPSYGRVWNTWYGEQLKTIAWAKNRSAAADRIFQLVDWSAGVGIAGHSMGGQATAISAHHRCAAEWGIRAAVLHHAAPSDFKLNGTLVNVGQNITTVPVAAFTSSGDFCCESSTRRIYDAMPMREKAFRDLKGSSHLEPVLWPPVENLLLATYTVAWFEIYLKHDAGAFFDLIYGKGPESLCKYQAMAACEVANRTVEE